MTGLLIVSGIIIVTLVVIAGSVIYVILMRSAVKYRDKTSMAAYTSVIALWIVLYFLFFPPKQTFEFCYEEVMMALE